ncbi:cytidine deaminase [Chloroflexota bacterium]
MIYFDIDASDYKVIAAAEAVLKKNYAEPRHTVGAAVLCSSGEIYTGVNIESCGYGPCAEPVAIGAAISNGERNMLSIAAVGWDGGSYVLVHPCGNCRQLIYDYAPDCMAIINHNNKNVKVHVRDLIPDAYNNF